MVFKLLGVVAALDRRLSRIRINFVPLNLVALAALAVGCARGLAMIQENFTAGLLLVILCAPAVALWVTVRLKRHVVFQPEAVGEVRSALESSGSEPVDMRMTGRLRLNRRTSRRFVEMGAQMMLIETGELMFFSEIDASTSFMGARVKERVGTWALLVPAAGLGPIRYGRLSFGGQIRAAAQFRVQKPGRRPQTVTLSFGTVDQRARVMRAIEARRAADGQRVAA